MWDINASHLEKIKNLKGICLSTTAFEWIDLHYCKENNIVVTNIPKYWGEKGYTESLKVAYKGTSVKVIGVYPGGINTSFYKNSRDYVTEEKQSTFMNPNEVGKIICDNIFTNLNLNVADIIIERN